MKRLIAATVLALATLAPATPAHAKGHRCVVPQALTAGHHHRAHCDHHAVS